MRTTYVKTQLQNIINISKIVTIHYYEFDKNFVFTGEKHDFWEMVYIDKGEMICTADDKRFVLKSGEMTFHNPNEFHNLSDAVLTIAFELGDVYSVEETGDGAIEIWIKPTGEEEPYAFYLFSYDAGVVYYE